MSGVVSPVLAGSTVAPTPSERGTDPLSTDPSPLVEELFSGCLRVFMLEISSSKVS